MAYAVKILADSLGPAGNRLTTFECTYPRFIHAEVLTHGQLVRNSASSRAIPGKRFLPPIIADPVLPVFWGKNKKGMSPTEELDALSIHDCQERILAARDECVALSQYLHDMHVHKQIANRYVEPWMWITTVISATEWGNFFALRTADDAQQEFQALARRMAVAYYDAVPEEVPAGFWHLPYITPEERKLHPTPILKKLSVARIARLSYMTHDGVFDLEADMRLHNALLADKHMSPFGHVAAALPEPIACAQFIGFFQYRKEIPGECRTFDPDPALLAHWRETYAGVPAG